MRLNHYYLLRLLTQIWIKFLDCIGRWLFRGTLRSVLISGAEYGAVGGPWPSNKCGAKGLMRTRISRFPIQSAE